MAEQNPPSGNKMFLNGGHGVFTDSGQSLGDSNTWNAALGDLSGDGDLDVFLGNATRALDPEQTVNYIEVNGL